MKTKRKILKTNETVEVLVNGAFQRTFVALAILLFVSLSCQAKTLATDNCNSAFKNGEHITYDLYFKYGIMKKVGTAEMSVHSMNYQNQAAYMINLLANTNGLADKFFRMRDTLTSIINSGLQPLYYRKAADEGHKYTIDEVRYSTSGGKYVVRMKKVKRGKTKYTSKSDTRQIYDMLSIISRVRSLNLEKFSPGQRLIYPIASGKSLTNETLYYKGKENYTAENGITYRCLIFTLIEDGKELITFYVTDDLNHLPIRLDLRLNFGMARASMRAAVNVSHPFTSIVKQ